MSEKTKIWFKRAGIRAIKTMAQTAAAMISTAALMTEVDWRMVVSASIVSGVFSMLSSIAGIPEVDQEMEDIGEIKEVGELKEIKEEDE